MHQLTLWSDALGKEGSWFNDDNEDNNHKNDKDDNNTDKVNGQGGALRWAAVGVGNSNAVGCLPGRGGWVDSNNNVF